MKTAKRYDLWKFTIQGESVIASSNNFHYLEKKAENIGAIHLYIYDNVELKKYTQ
jgi:hypothetical protein